MHAQIAIYFIIGIQRLYHCSSRVLCYIAVILVLLVLAEHFKRFSGLAVFVWLRLVEYIRFRQVPFLSSDFLDTRSIEDNSLSAQRYLLDVVGVRSDSGLRGFLSGCWEGDRGHTPHIITPPTTKPRQLLSSFVTFVLLFSSTFLFMFVFLSLFSRLISFNFVTSIILPPHQTN